MTDSTDLATQHTTLAAEYAATATGAAEELTAGRLWGLPELPAGDCWVDAAGAAVLAGAKPRTITGWLSRNKPRQNPFPEPHRLLYRQYWRHSEIQAWLQAWQQPRTDSPAPNTEPEPGFPNTED